MKRKRKSNNGLPKRVYLKNGAYRFLSPEKIRDPKDGLLKNWITLCPASDGEVAMYQALGKLLSDRKNDEGSMPSICAEYKANKLGRYSKDTQEQYARYLDMIADDFEDFYVGQVTTKDCADFLRLNFKDKPNTAQKYANLMRRIFRYAISEMGLRQDNPVDQLDLSDYETKRRPVLPTHEQIRRIREAGFIGKARGDTGRTLPTSSGPMFSCMVDMAYLCWQRAIDVRMLKEAQIRDGKIRFTPSKTAKTSGMTVDITITPAIQDVIDRARMIKKQYAIISPFLFPTRKGTAYTKSGLFSMWDRARDRAGVTEDIQFRDLRALGATDAAKRGENKKDIQNRLTHTTEGTTDIYIKEVVPITSEIVQELPWKCV